MVTGAGRAVTGAGRAVTGAGRAVTGAGRAVTGVLGAAVVSRQMRWGYGVSAPAASP
ncbi:hypothetical protein [Actinoplanes missouriensis]|uniref:hypothetical protein n=1 Tax=Actinoplanes missouriensis TaxID=1866 RepID=UPI003676949A